MSKKIPQPMLLFSRELSDNMHELYFYHVEIQIAIHRECYFFIDANNRFAISFSIIFENPGSIETGR